MSFRPSFSALRLPSSSPQALAFAGPALALDTDRSDRNWRRPPHRRRPPLVRRSAPGADRMMRGERNVSPRAVCLDMAARRIGDRAYIKARLELKPEQMAAWNAFEKAADEASSKSMARCATLPTEMKERPDYIQRLTMEEEAMKARVATIEAVKPSLTALYNTLTADQKAVFNRPRATMAGMMGGHHRR